MSHFIGLVFVRPDSDLDDMLEPFDEQSEIYKEFVDCTEEVKTLFGTLPKSCPSEGTFIDTIDKTEDVINIWKEAPEKLDEDADNKFWRPYTKEEFPTPRHIAEDKGYRIVPDESKEFGERYEMDVERNWEHQPSLEKYPTIKDLAKNYFCYRSVNGKFGYMSNPNAKWDWYSEGGRWGGYIINKKGKDTNSELLSEIDWDKTDVPFCLVDADGVWREKGEMGFWGMVSNEKPQTDWATEFKDYVKSISPEEAKEIVVYAIDFHI